MVALQSRQAGEERGHGKRLLNVMMLSMIIISIFLHFALSLLSSDDGSLRGISVENCKLLHLEKGDEMRTMGTPNYPQLILAEDICWVIQISPTIFDDHLIEISLNDLDFHTHGDCVPQTADQVMLIEGPTFNKTLLERWCSGWDSERIIVSCAHQVLVNVHISKHSIGLRGLNFTYKVIPKGDYDCDARKWRTEASETGDAAIAGVAIFLIILVVIVSIIVILKTRPRPHNRDQRQSSTFWQSPFDHRRFENEDAQVDNFDSIDQSEFNTQSSGVPGLNLSASMRSTSSQGGSSPRPSTRPLPIGIPQSYGADGFPSSYVCSVTNLSTREYPANDKKDSSSTEAHGGEEELQVENPLYDLAPEKESGLPEDSFSGISKPEVMTPSDPLSAFDLLESSNNSVHLSSALEEAKKMKGEVQTAASATTSSSV